MRAIFAILSLLAAAPLACGGDGRGLATPATAGPGAPSDGGAGDAAAGGDAPADGGGACSVTLPPDCTQAPPFVGPERTFRHTSSKLLVSPNHRGRDLFLNPADPQWVIGRFAYGAALAEVKLKDEEVDIWLNRDCGYGWEKIGTTLTTDAPSKPTVLGIDDEAGRIFFSIPENKKLGLGRHRLRLVVAGDLSSAEVFIEVVAPGTPMFVSDVDGTLTTSETVEFQALLTAATSPANASAADALTALAKKGYRPMYVTARPEWLVERTRDFVRERGFPAGIIHTTTGALPISGTAAVDFKRAELSALVALGLRPAWAFGNTVTDGEAYDAAKIQPLDHRVFYKFGEADGGSLFGGRRIEDYAVLLPELAALPNACP